MKKYSRKAAIGKMIVFGFIAVTAFTFALMLLWNWLMPVIFGLAIITFWQALGLLALSKILFGSGHKPNFRNNDKYQMHNMHKEQFMKRFGKKACNEDDIKKDSTDEKK